MTRKVQAELAALGGRKKVRRAWRDLRRAIAPVRDHDATGEHLVAGLREIGASEADIHAFERDWAARRARLWDAVSLPEPPPEFARPRKWRDRVREAADDDLSALRREAREVLDTADEEAWHEWRKNLKRYRYTLELGADPPQALLDLLQELGRAQDATVIRAALRDETILPAHRDALLRREDAAEAGSRERARELWRQLDLTVDADHS